MQRPYSPPPRQKYAQPRQQRQQRPPVPQQRPKGQPAFVITMGRRRINVRFSPSTIALMGAGLIVLMIGCLVFSVAGFAMLNYASGRILPGVSVAGVSLGGMSVEQATAELAANFAQIAVRDGDRSWRIASGDLGLSLDADSTAQTAVRYGRSEGALFTGLFGQVSLPPVLKVDVEKARLGLASLANVVDLPVQNASFRLMGGGVTPVAAAPGRKLNIEGTLSRLTNTAEWFKDGALELSMETTYPSVTDASALVNKVRAVIGSPLKINAYNPVSNQSMAWALPPEAWTEWLTTANTATGLALSLESAGLKSYLESNAGQLGESQYLNMDEAIGQIQAAIGNQNPNVQIRVYNRPKTHTIQRGETIGSLSWKYGIQMFLIAKANPGINMDALYPGQTITIPSPDVLLPLPIVNNKRIVVSISKQRVWVYQDGQMKWEWAASTGIPDSPTMPGIFQIRSHDGTAYAGNWNLYMPYFMSIYEAVPGFFNGFHGFPLRGGTQIIWENALGTRVTYGCILISNTNARALYEWAQDGVVVEIQA